MSDSIRNDPRAEAFLEAFEAALGERGLRARGILAEVKSDLEAAVSDAVSRGQSERDAWTEALDGLGDPQELAEAMRAPLPPFEPDAVIAGARGVVAILLAAWAVTLLWTIRSYDFGNRFGLFSFLACAHLPFVLLLWPGIVWRVNALYSTATATMILVLAWFVTFGSVPSTFEYDLGGLEQATPLVTSEHGTGGLDGVTALSSDPLISRATLAALLGLAAAVVVLSMIQQRAQRRRVILVSLGVLLAVDLPHTVEEAIFLREARSAAAWVDAERERTGELPSEEGFVAGYEPLTIDDLWYYSSGEDYSFAWGRRTQATCELGYNSDGSVWGND